MFSLSPYVQSLLQALKSEFASDILTVRVTQDKPEHHVTADVTGEVLDAGVFSLDLTFVKDKAMLYVAYNLYFQNDTRHLKNDIKSVKFDPASTQAEEVGKWLRYQVLKALGLYTDKQLKTLAPKLSKNSLNLAD